MKQKDNSTFRKKVSLRLKSLEEIDSPSVVETHGGKGLIWERCYRHVPQGVVFEIDEEKISVLGRQRPTWAVYGTDSEACLSQGVGFQFDPNFFDIDPYGDSWPIIDAIFEGIKSKPDKLVIVVNDGLRQKVKIGGAWTSSSLREVVEERVASFLYEQYLDVCRDLMDSKASAAGYDLAKWAGYHCGHAGDMTHFAAVLRLGSRG